MHEAVQSLSNHVRAFGMALSGDQLDLFEIYLRELIRWNERMNLTGVRGPDRMVTELFLDSLVPSPRIPGNTTLLDAGSGAGFPGLPLKILDPTREVHLLEPRAKRVSFLRQVIRVLGLTGIKVIQDRIGEGAPLSPEGYPVVTVRAFAPFPHAVRQCSPLLCSGGMLVGYLGEHGPEEIASAQEAAEEEGVQVEEVLPYTLPGKKGRRHIAILRKAPSTKEMPQRH
jgi:16S rRNA (guanine527-N7)-methyltransferase